MTGMLRPESENPNPPELRHTAENGIPTYDDDVLAEADRATLAHLLRAGIGKNSLRAMRSDLAYLESWSLACHGSVLSWPPSRGTILKFIAHHLWDPEERERVAGHGMPATVEAELRGCGRLRSSGPHAPSTVRRRLSHWRSACKWREAGDPFDDPVVRRTLAAAVRAADRPRERKSRKAVTGKIAKALISRISETCRSHPYDDRDLEKERLAALRDRAMIGLAFASGGRRRSEVANLSLRQISWLDPVESEGVLLPCISIRMRRTKTTDAGDDSLVYMTGTPVVWLRAWIRAGGIGLGPVFRRIDRWGRIHESGLDGSALNRILKARLAEIGEDPREYSAHGLRSGYITEARGQGIGLENVMDQVLHKSPRSTLAYHNDRERSTGQAARLL